MTTIGGSSRACTPPCYLALSELYFPCRGGHIVWFHEVCRRLGGVTLITRTEPGLPPFEALDGIRVHRVRLGRLPLLRPESLLLYANMLLQGWLKSQRECPEVILSARVLPEGAVGSVLAAALGVPNVIFAHGEEVHRLTFSRSLPRRRRLTAALKRRLLWSAFGRADLVIANSQFTASLLRQGVRNGRVAIVYLGADPRRFHPAPPDPQLMRQWDLANRKVLLTVGRLTPRKGQDQTLRALPAILARVPQAVYVIAGTGEYEPELRQIAADVGVADRVRFVGAVEESDLPRLYNLADLFLMPNRSMPGSGNVEGFGIVFLEAGASGLPVIGGRSGGVPDAVCEGQSGLLVDGASAEAIAEAALKLLTNPELARRMGEQGRRRVSESLTWDHCANRVRDLLNSLLTSNRKTANL